MGYKARTQFLSPEDLGVRVQAVEHGLVVQRILLLRPRTFLNPGAGGTNDGLDFGAIDEAGNVGIGDLGGREAGYATVRRGYKT